MQNPLGSTEVALVRAVGRSSKLARHSANARLAHKPFGHPHARGCSMGFGSWARIIPVLGVVATRSLQFNNRLRVLSVGDTWAISDFNRVRASTFFPEGSGPRQSIKRNIILSLRIIYSKSFQSTCVQRDFEC